jgi:glycolate oxidase FAD binding subunit
MRMADLLGPGEAAADAPGWWPGAPAAAPAQTLVRVSFWVSALARVLDAIDAAAGRAGVSPAIAGSAGAGVLYLRLAQDGGAGAGVPGGAGMPAEASRAAEFVAVLRGAVAGERGAVVVLAAPVAVREELAARGGMSGPVPGLALMRAVKDQFDPAHRLAPGGFPGTT